MSGSEVGGSVTFEYEPTELREAMTRESLAQAALADWRSFIGDPTAELPWNTSIAAEFGPRPTAIVTIRWERTA